MFHIASIDLNKFGDFDNSLWVELEKIMKLITFIKTDNLQASINEYFNSELKFIQNPEKLGNIYKLLSSLYINPDAKQYNFGERTGVCFATRKQGWHKNPINY